MLLLTKTAGRHTIYPHILRPHLTHCIFDLLMKLRMLMSNMRSDCELRDEINSTMRARPAFLSMFQPL